MSKAVVIGSLNYDIVLNIDKLPQCGETLPAQSAVFCAGGKGANQAVQLAKLGIETYMLGSVGNDIMGEYMRKNMESFGVNTDYLKTADIESGMGIIQALEDGRVYATIVRGANFSVTKADIDSAIPLLDDAEYAVLQLELPLDVVCYAIETAKKCNCKVVLNAAPAAELSEEILKKTDLLIVNEVEAEFYIGESITGIENAEKQVLKLAQRLENSCIFTLGKDGAVVSDGKKTEFIPPLDVKVVETTGAGDSFVGGITYSLIKGMDLFESAKLASCCSSFTIGGVGAQTSMPDYEKIVQMYEKI